MRTFLLLAALLVVGAAGCAEKGGADETTQDTTDFSDIGAEADETTGAILGIVLNDIIQPVADAKITLPLGTETKEAMSDAQGRFAFSKIPEGTYFVTVEKALHNTTSATVTAVAGEANPSPVKILLPRVFTEDPWWDNIHYEGFYTCSQSGTIVWGYSSSPCHAVCVPPFIGLYCGDLPVTLPQTREFHADVPNGWQTLIFELTWDESVAGTAPNMGVVVSTYKPERSGTHFFANVDGPEPLYFRLETGVEHPSAQQGGGPEGPIPAEGLKDMSYFMSVRGNGLVPALAIDQSFDVYLTRVVYAPAAEDWSFIRDSGTSEPF